MQKKAALIVSILIVTISGISQTFNTTWYFGTNAGIEFKNGKARAVSNPSMHAVEGTSVMCDSTGKVLFYTDGDTVWNRMHAPMINGTGLMGYWSSTQAAVIVPVPGMTDRYYVFTTDASEQSGKNGIRYHVVDMKKGNGLGELITKNILLRAPCSEKLIAVRHSNSKNIWIINHAYSGNTFYVWEIVEGGKIVGPKQYNTGAWFISSNVAGQMKISTDNSVIGMAIYASSKSALQLFRFNNATGEISSCIDLNLPSYESYAYGFEFSPSGKKVFCSTSYGHKLYSFDISSWDKNKIASSVKEVGVSASSYTWAMQLGPDGKIYVAHDHYPTADKYLGVIEDPDGSCIYRDKGFFLDKGGCLLGLPNNFNPYVKPAENIHLPEQVEQTACMKSIVEESDK